MHFDERVPEDSRKQFATQTEHLSDLAIATFKPMFRGVETKDFNEGLLAGLASVYQILRVMPEEDHIATVGAMIAIVSREMSKLQE